MDRNEYTIQQQPDGMWAVMVNGTAFLAGLSKNLALNMAAKLEQQQDEQDDAEGEA